MATLSGLECKHTCCCDCCCCSCCSFRLKSAEASRFFVLSLPNPSSAPSSRPLNSDGSRSLGRPTKLRQFVWVSRNFHPARELPQTGSCRARGLGASALRLACDWIFLGSSKRLGDTLGENDNNNTNINDIDGNSSNDSRNNNDKDSDRDSGLSVGR